MKLVTLSLLGRELYLAMNAQAMFEFIEEYGDDEETGYTKAMFREGIAGFKACAHMIRVLSEQGELVRRYAGYDHTDMVTEREILQLSSPLDFNPMRQAIMNAILVGFGQEITSDDEVDLGLIELQKKKVST